jgi:hypothetical protein
MARNEPAFVVRRLNARAFEGHQLCQHTKRFFCPSDTRATIFVDLNPPNF